MLTVPNLKCGPKRDVAFLAGAEKIKRIEDIFNFSGAVINTQISKNGKYTSVSINVRMKNPDAVIKKYKEVAEKIEGVISL